MLVLSRKTGERIHIGDNIVIEVRRVAGNRVTLAVDAPRDIRILRGELQQAATEFEPEKEESPAATSSSTSQPAAKEPYVVAHNRISAVNTTPQSIG